MKDLVLLVADKNAQYALRGVLSRPEAMGTRPIVFDFLVHPGRDGGVRKSGHEVVALRRRLYAHALLILDYEGCGTEMQASELEVELDALLGPVWEDSAKAIVLEPEVDVWMWGSDNALRNVLPWQRNEPVRPWIERQGFELLESGKPRRPKEALECLLRATHMPRSSSIYEQIASKVSLPRCTDPAFQRLRGQLQQWFPPS